jgi:salicylate hydroxylase
MGVRPEGWLFRRWNDGTPVLRTPLGAEVEAEFGSPHYQMHRADLVMALARALPAERVHTGRRLVSFVDHGTAVEAQFENGERARADVLVGADGIHSTVRAELFGPEQPHFTGCVAYRGLVPTDTLKHLGIEVAIQIWMGPQSHFAHYYVRGRRLLNFVAVMEQDTWTTESWTEPGNVADLRNAFQDWHPQVRGILERVPETFRWALFDRSPMAHWSDGRVTLLGDACHAMLPFMAQGAAQSIEDGATLAGLLSRIDSDSVPDALLEYESIRRPRVTRVHGLSEANKRRLHLPDGTAQRERDAEMAEGATDFSFSAVDWLYRYDAEQLHQT